MEQLLRIIILEILKCKTLKYFVEEKMKSI